MFVVRALARGLGCGRAVINEMTMLGSIENNAASSSDVTKVMCPAFRVNILTLNDGIQMAFHGSEVGHDFNAVFPPVPWAILLGSERQRLGCFCRQYRRHQLELALGSAS